MNTKPALFISYRRTHLPRVRQIEASLQQAGIGCFLDVHDIDPLADFPDTIREAIGRSHAFLAWWSADYGDSDHCQQEFRHAWQHARRRSSDLARRVWIVNPEERGDHLFSGELDSRNFLKPPSAGGELLWAEALLQRFQHLNLITEGPLADERDALPAATLYGVPEKSREFTGRGPELMRIHSKLHPARIGDQGSAVAVQMHGLGGVGKTELATAYAREFAPAYPGGVFWLNLAGWQPGRPAREDAAELAWLRALEQTFRLQPESLGRLTRDAEGKELPAAAVRERLAMQLSQHGDYLWVIDNVPELSPLDVRGRILQFLRAPSAQGHKLLTTRDSRPADGFAAEPLGVLNEEDALRLLTKYRPMQAREEVPAMHELITEVGAHTQTLMLLGEYARDAPGGYPDVLGRIEAAGAVRRIDEIAERLQDLLGTKARGIVATFALSIEPLAEAAKEVLSLASVCTPNVSIPEELLARVVSKERTDDFGAALGTLLRASLLQRRAASGRGVVIHPLVAEATLSLLEADAQGLRRRVADGLLESVENAPDIRDHPAMLDSIEQARGLGGRLDEERGVTLLLRVGQFETARGRFAAARSVEVQAVDLGRHALGEEHPYTLTAMNNLAITLASQGDLGGAHALDEQALSLRKRVLGKEHPDTLSSMNSVAERLREQGDLGAARALHEQTLSMQRRALGEEHPDTLISMNNLALTLKDQGDLRAARALQEQALSIRRRVQGEDHPDLLPAMSGLAVTLSAQGDLGAARALQEQVLSIHLRVFGAEHPETLISMSNLGATLQELGDLGAARTLQEEAVSTSRRVLGEEHPDTLLAINNLATTLYSQRELSAARVLQEQVLSIRRRVLGAEHPSTLLSMNSLSNTIGEQGDLDAARSLLEEALATYRRVLGEKHPDTLTSMSNLANTLYAQEDLSAARVLHEQTLSIRERVLGKEHPDTLSSMYKLANTLRAQGDLDAARTLQDLELSIARRVMGDEHPDTLTSMNNLALTLRAQGDSEAARTLQEQALSIRRRTQGDEHPDTTTAASHLIDTLLEVGDKDSVLQVLHSTFSWLLERDSSRLSADQRSTRDSVCELIKEIEA
jgi:tetratricopeptide (TPR) repeat protein